MVHEIFVSIVLSFTSFSPANVLLTTNDQLPYNTQEMKLKRSIKSLKKVVKSELLFF